MKNYLHLFAFTTALVSLICYHFVFLLNKTESNLSVFRTSDVEERQIYIETKQCFVSMPFLLIANIWIFFFFAWVNFFMRVYVFIESVPWFHISSAIDWYKDIIMYVKSRLLLYMCIILFLAMLNFICFFLLVIG